MPAGQSTRSLPPLRQDSVQSCSTSVLLAGASTDPQSAALSKRAQLLRQQAAERKARSGDRSRCMLRAKILDLLREVKRRQQLHKQQLKSQRLREQSYERGGRAPLREGTGHATECALGLVGLDDDCPALALGEGAPSPRRACILDSLSLAELDALRRDPWFFFRGLMPAGWIEPGSEADVDDVEPPALDAAAAAQQESVERLVEFFVPAEEELDMPIGAYVEELRSRCAPSSEDLGAGSSSASTGRGPAPPAAPCRAVHERMPCLGRRPSVRADELSPTLEKVRAVWNRRNSADAEKMEAWQEAIARRSETNAFKSREQQREAKLHEFERKELHMIRMVEAEDRKVVYDADQEARAEELYAQKRERFLRACERAEDLTERRRDQLTGDLAEWQGRVREAERQWRARQRRAAAAFDEKWSRHRERRLLAQQQQQQQQAAPRPGAAAPPPRPGPGPGGGRDLSRSEPSLPSPDSGSDSEQGEVDSTRRRQLLAEQYLQLIEEQRETESQRARRNAGLRSHIQASHLAQLEARRRAANSESTEARSEKLEAARLRRQKLSSCGSKHGFVEKAGLGTTAFDPKYAVATDRRSQTWHSCMRDWSTELERVWK